MGDYGNDSLYANLASCRVMLTGSGGASSKPPVRLPTNCLNAANMPLPKDPYDFALERRVVKRKDDFERDRILMKATSREELQEATLTKMKSVTGAKDDVCVAMLESHGYDLKTSIETFFLNR